MTVLITLIVAGANTGPFNLYSDVDGYVSPFESGVAKSALLAGYTSTLVPLGTNVIRVISSGECTNYIDIVIGETPTTTTTSTACVRPGGLANFNLAYAIDDPFFDFRGSLIDACLSLNAIAYTGLTGQALSLLVGETVYYGLGTDCILVPTGYYIIDGGTVVVYIVDGIVDSYPSCSTTTTTTTATPTTTTTTTTGIINVIWYAEKFPGCPNNAYYSVGKNGFNIFTGTLGAGASNSFTAVVGDDIQITNTSADSGAGCNIANVTIDRNTVNIVTDTQSGYGVTATANFTITPGTTSVVLYAGYVS